MWYALELGQLPQPYLVKDLARFLVSEVVVLGALMAGQKTQGAGGDRRSQGQRLHGRNQTVATKRHGKPRDAGGWNQVAVDVVDQQAQVLQGAAQQLVEELVIGFDLG